MTDEAGLTHDQSHLYLLDMQKRTVTEMTVLADPLCSKEIIKTTTTETKLL